MDRQRALKCKDRFLKLSLKKNRVKDKAEVKKLSCSSDCIIINESFEQLKTEFPRIAQPSPKIYSPIVIEDSDESHNEYQEPSKNGNVSFNCSKEETPTKQRHPSTGGWSPAQSILCATPRNNTLPSTPTDVANESLEECSIKKIQNSQRKLLTDLYGDTWTSIPTLLKTIKHKYKNIDSISKKLQFNDDESDKENIRKNLAMNKKLYLTITSDLKAKQNLDLTEKTLKKKLFTEMISETPNCIENSNLKAKDKFDLTEKTSKKKLYTEKNPDTPDVTRNKPIRTRKAVTTTKKKKAMSVTELVESMKDQVNKLTEQVQKVHVADPVPVTPESVKRLTFVGSLADNVPSWRCHVEALQYHDNFKNLKEQLSRRLYVEFNKHVFGDQLDADMLIVFDGKLRSTAGTTTNRLIRTSKGDRIRTSSVKLSTKVCDNPQRLRDTLIHEICHAATWLIDGELRAGHGPLWKKWATRSLQVYPELGEISRCHDLQIHYKYAYKCTQCGYSIQRHSKSIDVTKKCCGYCRGKFEVIVNRKKKDGVIVSTPARKGGPNDFALYVKENYSSTKDGTKTHAQVMKILGEQFSAKKNKINT